MKKHDYLHYTHIFQCFSRLVSTFKTQTSTLIRMCNYTIWSVCRNRSFLTVEIDSTLASTLIRMCNYTIWSVCRNRSFLTVEIDSTLARCLVFSRLDPSNSLLFGTPAYQFLSSANSKPTRQTRSRMASFIFIISWPPLLTADSSTYQI
ncbi:hypothetical protein HELRODRAFT_175494 [Helobdella robusta]|uniref:Uncharacterized protein n=1 Tax=Helobdella robusta TaxID=6412 RepID=T1F9B9_HELRO|nr:hypothetical protein HELRODRAFT_175494 [Helobdella robusta]ESO00536.1 hypothetical protein HELRODRAFT_175494 [Helobdella robusta]